MTTKDRGHNNLHDSSRPSYIRLSELASIVGQVLDSRFGQSAYWVLAEVSGHQYKQEKNYHSFELVEKRTDGDALMAKFTAKAWGAGAVQIQQFERLTGQKFTSNLQVLAKIKVVFHQQYGLALDLLELDAAYTVGKLYEARQLTLQKLVADNDFIEKTTEGYWTRNKGATLPAVLQKLAIISSLTSAGMEDFIHTLEKNPEGYFFELDKYLTVVQGVDNADQIVDQFIQIFKSGKQYDAVLLLRGGGAQTDFILFDQYQVARAVAKFPVPIITGIGHQKNETLADLMAHTSTKTPTQAAEFILHHNRSFENRLMQLRQSVALHAKSLLGDANNALNALNGRLMHRSRDFLQYQQTSLIRLQSGISQAAKHVINQNELALQQSRHEIFHNASAQLTGGKTEILRQKEKIKTWSGITLKNADAGLRHQQTSIRLMSPARILQKGFALIRKNGRIITEHRSLNPEDSIDLITSQVTLEVTIQQKKENNDGTGFNL